MNRCRNDATVRRNVQFVERKAGMAEEHRKKNSDCKEKREGDDTPGGCARSWLWLGPLLYTHGADDTIRARLVSTES